MTKKLKNIVLEDSRVLFRNFSGKEGQYNRAGDRNFCVLLDTETADAMANDGWNIKELKPLEEGDDPQPYIQVTVGYKGRPPRVVMVTSRGKTHLDEDMVEMLDWVDVAKTDLIIRPYQWEVNGKTGVKAYLQSLYMTIVEDELELKYGDVPDTPDSALTSTTAHSPWHDEQDEQEGPPPF